MVLVVPVAQVVISQAIAAPARANWSLNRAEWGMEWDREEHRSHWAAAVSAAAAQPPSPGLVGSIRKASLKRLK